MQNVLIVGGGTGGLIILDLLQNLDFMKVKAIIDTDERAPGVTRAKELGIEYGSDWKVHLKPDIHIVFDVSGNETVFAELLKARSSHTVLIPGSVANLLVRLLEENDTYTKRIRAEVHKQRMVFDSVDEGMIGINKHGKVDFFNNSAARMTGTAIENAIGKVITEVIPTSRLTHVFESGRSELNKELVLANGLKIVTSRYPLHDHKGKIVGSFAVFKDMTEVLTLAEEITDLKKVQTMLEAIIHSSDDAISVVDENGNGILVNPAYTRITGLTAEEVIGKPAAVDISEGESIHMKVLKTRQPVRGVNMRVGEKNNEVIVNVAPIIVDRQIRGSVGVIHDITEMRNLMNELDRARTIIRKLESTYTFDDVYGNSTDIEIAIKQAKLSAQNNLPVLLRGEAGSGKELFAHAIHSESEQKFSKFVRVNCSNHPDDLEAELFGSHVDSKTTDIKDSLFIQSTNGTLFLDEIADMPLEIQRKILIYLREGIIYPGSSKDPLRLPVRIIAASSKSLEKAIHDGTFLEELYYLLNRISIQIPSLRSRKEDIPVIVENLLIKLNQEFGMNVKGITKEAQDFLKRFDWPGNVRELENVLSRAMIYTNQEKTILELEDITKSLFSDNQAEEDSVLPDKSTLASIMDDYEKTILELHFVKIITINRLLLPD